MTRFHQVLKQYFGYDSFRSIQLDIIQSIADGHDTLGLMPTGGGKSITFQVPALTMEGVCLVVTPLIALMKDQVQHLKEKGIKAEALYSGQTRQEMDRILDNAIYGAVKFLYLSPERLSTQLFLQKLYYMKVCFITVDEAHCISQWGYDFRPAYLSINKIRETLPYAPVLALTATATPMVVDDIQQKLDFGKYNEKVPQVFKMSFRRENLAYVVRKTEDKLKELIHILKAVPGSSIVYTRNRDKTKQIAEELTNSGITATFYHAGLDHDVKDDRQAKWQKGEVRVMTATNAFGMGIDKPDVRTVIHMDCPDSLEAYFQEAGRGGRDGNKSYAVLLYNGLDRRNLLKHSSTAFPPKEYIRKVYEHLAYFFELAVESGEGARYEFNEGQFCYRFKHYPQSLEGALSVLQNAGYLNYDADPDSQPRVMFRVNREGLYGLENLHPNEDRVINTLLRYYGSLFTDLTYINEKFISEKCGITEEHLRFALRELGRKHIITYVPRRNVPIITYTQQRIDSDRLRFSKEVYEVLKMRMEERVKAVINYCDTDDECRQAMLMEYFGEKDATTCGHCDVCLSHNHKTSTTEYEKKIKDFVAANGKIHITKLTELDIPNDMLHLALENLREDEIVKMDGPFISLL